MPTAQPMSTPRWRCQPSPSGLSRRDVAVGRPGCTARRPAPTSRWAVSSKASPTSPTNATPKRPNTHQLSWSYGRICWPQPIGDSHDGHELTSVTPPSTTLPDTSPTARSRKATPIAAAAIPLAPRAVSETCAVTAAIAAKAMPTAAMPAPAANEPAGRQVVADQHDGAERRRAPHWPRRRRSALRSGWRAGRRCPRRSARPGRSPRSAGVPYDGQRAHERGADGDDQEGLGHHRCAQAGARDESVEHERHRAAGPTRSRALHARCSVG